MSKLLSFAFIPLLVLSSLLVVPYYQLVDWPTAQQTAAPIVTTTTTAATTTTITTNTTTTTATTTTATTTTVTPTTTTTTATTTTTTTVTTTTTSAVLGTGTVAFPDTLFIGDSRAVGLMEYGRLKEADFFCKVGMTAYNVIEAKVKIRGVGSVTLQEMLQKKPYRQVYIILGINELGYPLEKTVQQYRKLIDFIHLEQPDVQIVLHASMHVTQECNDITKGPKAIFTNERIDRFNGMLWMLADELKLPYLNANSVFDDRNGCLNAEYAAADGAHIRGKEYLRWREFLHINRV